MILLTLIRLSRGATVKEVFDEQDVSVFGNIGDVDSVDPFVDTSPLHLRMALCYKSSQCIPYEFNMDTKENKGIEIRKKELMHSLPPMSIDRGVKTILQDYDNKLMYTLDQDKRVIPLYEVEEGNFMSLFAFSTYPKDLSKCVLRHRDYLIKRGNKVNLRELIPFESNQSVIRICRDIFFLFDMDIKKWVLPRTVIH